MRAVRLHAAGDLRVEDIALPRPPQGGEVSLKPAAAGICGSDLHNFKTGAPTRRRSRSFISTKLMSTPIEPDQNHGGKKDISILRDGDISRFSRRLRGDASYHSRLRTRARSSSNPARPYMDLFSILMRHTCPSTGLVVQGDVTAAWIAS
jgi:hypothetical protein